MLLYITLSITTFAVLVRSIRANTVLEGHKEIRQSYELNDVEMRAPATEKYESAGIALAIGRDNLPQDTETARTAIGNLNMTEEELRAITTPEGTLFREIMKNYDKNTRPVFNASHMVTINLTFTFSQVLNVEEKEQSMSVILWMDHYWYDEKLVWNPAKFNNITQIIIPSNEIWLPDIVLYNTAEDIIKRSTYANIRAFIHYTGRVFWPPIMRFRSSCNIDITYFPFDDQVCYLKLGSWAYDGFQVDIWNLMSEMDMSHALTNTEFTVVSSSVRRYVTYYDCCVEPYPDVKVYILIRRQTIQHVFNIVIPCIVLSIICMVGFLIPPDRNDEKISVQLTVLFSLSLFMLLVAESTPRTSESVPLLSIYLTALMCITAMSTTVHVVCDKLVASANVRNELPYALNKALYHLLHCCKSADEEEEVKSEKDIMDIPNGVTKKDQRDGENVQTETRSKTPVVNGGRVTRKRGQSMSVLQNTRQAVQGSRLVEQTEEGLQGLFHHLKVRQDKMRSELKETAKWYKVAAKMDRIFFWSYGIAIVILTLYAFLFKPMQKKVTL